MSMMPGLTSVFETASRYTRGAPVILKSIHKNFSFLRALETQKETLRLDGEKIAGWGRRTDQALADRGWSRGQRNMMYGLMATTAAAGLGLAFQYAAWQASVQMLGLAGCGIMLLGSLMKNNRHIRGNILQGQFLMTPHLLLLGDGINAFCGGVAGLRALAMNGLEDKHGTERLALSAGIWAGMMGGALGFGLVKSPMDCLPLLGMTFTTVADFYVDRATHLARLLRIAGSSSIAPSLVGSWGGLVFQGMTVLNLFSTAVQKDVPVRDENGEALTMRRQFSGWWQSVKNRERISESLSGRPHPLKEFSLVAVNRSRETQMRLAQNPALLNMPLAVMGL